MKARILVSVSMKPHFRNSLKFSCLPVSYHGKNFSKRGKKILDYDGEYAYLTVSPKSHVPVGVRRTLDMVRKSVRYLELTAPVATPANRNKRGHLEATTVRAFLVSAGFPTAGVTEEAHLH